MPTESFFKISGRIKDAATDYDEDFKIFVKGLDDRHAVMIARDVLRHSAPNRDGVLLGKIIIESIEKKPVD